MTNNTNPLIYIIFLLVGCTSPRNQMIDKDDYMQSVAVYHWSQDTSLSPVQVVERYTTLKTSRADQTCITLEIKDKTVVGGAPSYCFDSKTMLLKEKISDVE